MPTLLDGLLRPRRGSPGLPLSAAAWALAFHIHACSSAPGNPMDGRPSITPVDDACERSAPAKPGTLAWWTSIGDTGFEAAAAVSASSEGLFISGHHSGRFRLGAAGEVESRGANDAFLVHYGLDGTPRWIQSVGGRRMDSGLAVASTAERGVILAGGFSETVAFGAVAGDIVASSAGGLDGYVTHFSQDGLASWTVTVGGAGRDQVGSLDVERDFVWVGGRVEGEAWIGRTPERQALASDAASGFVARIGKSDGRLDWSSTIGSISGGVLSTAKVAVVHDGVVVAATYGERQILEGADGRTLTVDPKDGGDILVARFNTQGKAIWLRRLDSLDSDEVGGISATRDGGVYVSGTRGISASLTRLDGDGAVEWERVAIGTRPVVDWGVSAGEDGVAWIGIFEGRTAFGGGSEPDLELAASGAYDVYIVRYGATGDLMWGHRIGGREDDFAGGVALLGGCYVVAVGSFQGELEDDCLAERRLVSRGDADGFVAAFHE